MSDTHLPSLKAPAPRREAIARWKRRTVVVHLARKALPAAIVGILLVMTGWVVVDNLKGQVAALAISARDIRMDNPRFYGRDSKDRPFLLAARQAVRTDADPNRLTLAMPEFSLGTGKVTAKEGSYREGDKRVVLTGDVLFVDGKGGRMETQQAYIDTKTGRVTNGVLGRGIEVASPMGIATADAYSIGRNGEVVFRGNVHARIKAR